MPTRLLNERDFSRFRHLTYPALRDLLGSPSRADVICAGAISAGCPTGLAVCRVVPGRGFEIASLYSALTSFGVDDRRELLRTVVEEAGRRGERRGVFHATVAAGDDRTPAMLGELGWRGPTLRNVVARTTVEAMLTLPFASLGSLRHGHRICDWHEVPAAAREELRARVDAVPQDARREIDPFAFEERAHPAHGAALLSMRGEVLAWHLPERLDERIMRWTCSTGVPGERRGTAIMMLWKHVLSRQQDEGIPELVWGVPILQPGMMRFVTARLRPALTALSFGMTYEYDAAGDVRTTSIAGRSIWGSELS